MTEFDTSLERLVARVHPVLDAVTMAGGQPTIVGGAVRDALLGLVATEIDIEASGLSIEALSAALSSVGRTNIVGQAFGVLRVDIPGVGTFDVSVPRIENKIGRGHRAFAVEFGALSPEAAAARRDFTINSLAFDPHSHRLIDPYGGAADLRAGILRHTSPAYAEDPLRVLRGMQFAARFNLTMARETADLSRQLLPEAGTLAIERVWEEWRKWAEKSTWPAAGLRVLVDSGWITLYPELAVLIACPQDPEWHPEGDVFQHTLFACDAAGRIASREKLQGKQRVAFLLATLCHDLGKPLTTVRGDDGHVRSPGHAEAGIVPAETFLARIGCRQEIVNQILPLIREHLAHISLPVEPRPVRRLAVRLSPATITQWGQVVEADHSGRPPLPAGNPAAPVVALAEQLSVEQGTPKPLLMGRHLLERGMSPGPEMGRLLKAAYEAQIAGEFETVEEALSWAIAFEA